MPFSGPGQPYQLLFDEDEAPGPGLPADARAILGGDWRAPAPPPGRPHVLTNFVASHDGRISFDLPGRSGGGDVSRHAPHDTWLMGLVRARADAILTGGGTLRVTRRHTWVPEAVFPADAAAYAALRAAEGRPPLPALVVLSASGDLPADAAALRVPGQELIVATTAAGAARARATLGERPGLSYHITDGDDVDLAALLRHLREERGVRQLLSEGGARVYGALIAAGLVDEIFLTRSPVVVGSPPPPARPRPSLVEGVAFSPDRPPTLRLISLRRHGSYLFERALFGRA